MSTEHIYELLKDVNDQYQYVKRGELVRCRECIHYTSTILRKQPDGTTRLTPACNKGISADNPRFYCGWGKSR